VLYHNYKKIRIVKKQTLMSTELNGKECNGPAHLIVLYPFNILYTVGLHISCFIKILIFIFVIAS